MAMSSQGIGSGLDVNSIVTQLVAIEKQPLQQLQTKATKLQSQLSLYGTVKSQMSTWGDAAANLAQSTSWNTQKATVSNTAAISVAAGSAATAGSFSVDVTQLAKAQSAASAGVTAGSTLGLAGTLTFQLGSWSGASPSALSFSAGSTPSVAVTVVAGDTTTTLAAKINAAGAGVTASVLKDGANERLVIRSNATGLESGFSVEASGDAGLSQFEVKGVVDTTNSTPASGMFMSQTGQNAKVKINGLEISSTTNKFTGVMTGVDLTVSQLTTAPVDVAISNDTSVAQKNIQAFVDAYNALNTTLGNATKYDSASKVGGPLQADATSVGLLNAMRSMMGSSSTGSTYTRLSEIGLERQTDGSIKINTTKLNSALENLDNLKKLFTTDNSSSTTNGFGLKVRDFARGMVGLDGQVSAKSTAIQSAISRNSKDQSAVTERAARIEASLRAQYSSLDTKMASISGLSSYVASQIAQWNKTS